MAWWSVLNLTQVYEWVDFFSKSWEFQVFGIPLATYWFAMVSKALLIVPLTREHFHLGLEFCVMSVGIYWATSNMTPLLEEPGGVFLFVLSFFLLLTCAACRNLLRHFRWTDLIVGNVIGVASLMLSFGALLGFIGKVPL